MFKIKETYSLPTWNYYDNGISIQQELHSLYLNMGLNRFTKQKLNKEQTFNNVKKHLGYI